MKKFNARLLGPITRNFEYSKIRQKIRVSSTRCSTVESLIYIGKKERKKRKKYLKDRNQDLHRKEREKEKKEISKARERQEKTDRQT